jgi:hypothetical protein
MHTLTSRDVERCKRCPLLFRLYKAESSSDLSAFECMDRAVRDTVIEAGNDRIMKRTLKEDDLLSAYWDRWDSLSPHILPSEDSSNLDYIRLGETCIRNFVKISSWKDASNIVAAGMKGKFKLSDDITLNLTLDEVTRASRNIVITRYVTEPVLWSKEDLQRDWEMSIDALWAQENVPDAKNISVQWIFLSNGTYIRDAVQQSLLEQNRDLLLGELESLLKDDALPRETLGCSYCQYRTQCPRFLHELSLDTPERMSLDAGVRLVDEYAELTEKINALESRKKVLETKRGAVMNEIIAFADANGFMSVTGHTEKVLVKHEKKVDLPEDKTELIDKLKSKGLYDGLSMVNYSKLRSDIAKGAADPEIASMARISRVDKLYMKRRRPDRPHSVTFIRGYI